jgi:hypothetical protein
MAKKRVQYQSVYQSPNLRTRVSRVRKAPVQSPPTPKPPASKPPAKNVEYAFLNKSRCPHCGVTTTECLSVVGAIQYRRCLAPVCRTAYKVSGTPI